MIAVADALVVDASVALKWVVAEPESASAERLRAWRLWAPDLLLAECANALWKKVARCELDGAEAGRAAELLRRAPLRLVGARSLITESVALANELDHPAYDCFYLTLARSLETVCVSTDARLARVLRERAGGRHAGLLVGLEAHDPSA